MAASGSSGSVHAVKIPSKHIEISNKNLKGNIWFYFG